MAKTWTYHLLTLLLLIACPSLLFYLFVASQIKADWQALAPLYIFFVAGFSFFVWLNERQAAPGRDAGAPVSS
jgi:hypothetical protein